MHQSVSWRRGLRSPLTRLLIASGSATLASLALAKYVAVTSGTVGVGILSAFLGSASVLVSLANLGLPWVLPTLVSGKPRPVTLIRLSIAIQMLVVAAVFFWVALASMASAFEIFHGSYAEGSVVIWAGFSAAGTLSVLCISAVSSRLEGARVAARQTGVGAIVGAIVTITLLWSHAVTHLPQAIGLGGLSAFFYAAIEWCLLASRLRRHRNVAQTENSNSISTVESLLKKGLQTWAAALPVGIAWGLFPMLTLWLLGGENAGIFRAGLTIGMLLVTIGNPWVAYVTFPGLAECKLRGLDPGETIRRARRRSVYYLGSLALILVLLSPILLWVFYAPEFVPATLYVPLMVTYGLLQVGSQVGQSVLKVRHDWKAQLWTQSLSAFILLACAGIAVAWLPTILGMALALVAYGASLVLIVEIALWRMGAASMFNSRRESLGLEL